MNNNSPNAAGQADGHGGSKASSPLDRYSVQPRQEDDKSPYFKSAAPSISLPKGGGAIKGIDEKFSVNAVNGTAGLEIGLPLTPGRGGFTPALSLSYNSGSGNSEFGLGWGLSLPAIQRKTDKKLPRYNDASESDVFLLAGAEDLVPELDGNNHRIVYYPGDYTVKRYRPRIEGLFARIEFISLAGNTDTWWRVTTKDNITTYYGLNPQSRIADPEDASRIFKWLPDITVDHKGNVQQFFYTPENLDEVAATVYEKNRLNETAKITNTYLKRVCYGNLTPYFIATSVFKPTAMPVTDWLFEAVLDYGDHSADNYSPATNRSWLARNDAFSDFHAGFEIRTYRKCRRVLMFHRFTELNSGTATLVRSLDLVYQNDDAPAAVETDFIIESRQTGYIQQGSGYTAKSLPAMTFNYEPLNWNTEIQSVSKDNFTGAPQGLTGPYQWTDFEGEGISGILTEQGNGWFYKNNLGNGHFQSPKLIAEKPSFNGLGAGLQWQDLDADGRRQVVAQQPIKGFWEADGPDAFTKDDLKWAPFKAFEKNINIDWNSPFTKSLDLDGDGRADVLITEDRAWSWYANKGKEGFDFGGNAPIFQNEEKGPMLLLRDAVQSIFLADMSGDGMTDLVRIRNGEVCYWPNKGFGAFGAKVTMQNAPVFHHPELFDPMYLSLADISGTGAADLIFTGRNTCTAWINFSGNAFGEPFNINPLPGTDPYSKLAILDFLGNGTGCIVWSSPLPQHAHAPIQYIDLMGGKKPYLMTDYNSGTGKIVSVTYKSSTQFYLDDKLKGIRWATRLPFPVHCVEQITTYDVVSATTFSQRYKYRHGYYDHEEREFRGFGYVETVDIDSAIASENEELDQKPVLTKTWYHTGAWIREQSLLDRFKQEYFQFEGWDDLTKIASFPTGLNAQELREAHRALKGSPLRQEVYALDGDPDLESIPYAITATAYEVKKIQALATNRYASFINFQQQSIAFSCERNVADPRIMHQLTLETDELGNVLQSAQVAYKRKDPDTTLPPEVQAEQGKMHISCTQNKFTTDAIDDIGYTHYRLRLPCEAHSFEAVVNHATVVSGALWTVDLLKAAIDNAEIIDFSETATNGQKRLLGHSRSLYLSDDTTTPLAAEHIESLGLPYQSYQLAFTPKTLDACYADFDEYGIVIPGSNRAAGMLGQTGNEGDAYVDLLADGCYWVPSGTAVYTTPASKFYLPEKFTDPWGNQTTVTFWGNYYLLPQQVKDALDNVSSVVSYDWRILQPIKMKDANDNITEMLYDALGMPVAMAVKGKDTGTEGDNLDGIDPESTADINLQADLFVDPTSTIKAGLLQGATWRCVYDLESLPVSVAMIARQHHVHGSLILPEQDTEHIVRFSYSDGLGRVIMHKAQCEPNITLQPGGNLVKEWIGTGRTIYNNKGNVVMQYEPYFSASHECDTAEQAAEQGISPRMHYDALNRPFLTDMPDGTFSKTTWTAWEQKVYDPNDTVLDSQWYALRSGGGMGTEELAAAVKAAAHADTPTVMHTDTLARPFYTIQYLSPITDTTPVIIKSHVQLDIQGNRMAITDGRGMVPLKYKYNLLQAPCYQTSKDSGTQRTLLNVGGQPLAAWDADDRRFTMVYDELRRPTEKRLNDDILLDKTEYKDTINTGSTLNQRGQVFAHYDSSGKQSIPNGYDFKGNPIVAEQHLLADKILSDADWDTLTDSDLDTEAYSSASIMDALGRPVEMTDPGSNIHNYIYDKGGALKKVLLNSTEYVKDIHYNAKGQRDAIWYGNGTKTGYTYDDLNYRLRRLLTVNVDMASVHYNEILQDLNYWYDPVGNITQINDGAQQTLFYANTLIDPTQKFTYDALYRLIKAEGREQIGTNTFGPDDNTKDAAWKVHLGSDAAQTYVQRYTYDEAGNILELKHCADNNSYTRTYNYTNANNRLNSTVTDITPATVYSYTYDNRGNMITMPHLSAMDWNATNELRHITRGTNDTWYQYSGGQRIRKYTDKVTIQEERIYLGSFEIYRKFEGSSLIVKRTTVHISDDTGRIAMLEKRTAGIREDDHDTDETLVRYIYSNHLQSASLELNGDGEIISYEEYHPYGTTAYQAKNCDVKAVAKRYRYTGKERDDESGLYYHGARYYLAWLGRWCSCDPLESKYGGMSPYNYSFNNPVVWDDPTGADPDDVITKPKPKVNIHEPLKIKLEESVLHEKGKAAQEIDKILLQKAEKKAEDVALNLEKVVLKKAEKEAAKKITGATILKIAGKGASKLNVILDIISMIDSSPPDGAGALSPEAKRELDGLIIKRIEAEKTKYDKAHPPQKLTTDISKLTEHDKNEIATRIATGEASRQDLIYASQIMKGNGRGLKRADSFGDGWSSGSLGDALKIFTPNYVLTSTDQKLVYTDNDRGYEVIYDKEGDYFRIRDMRLPGRRVFVDFSGQVPNNKTENGRVSGRTQDEYNQVTHYKNIDKSR
jgi:RHS repeat-associated protein